MEFIMSKKMLIDAAHPEETRVALIDENNRLIEYDFESTTKQTIKGNIYLAKVMRVEPSLQAAFVDYGGNRHGFLAFSEIHPDYFRIPVSDREALTAQLKEDFKEEEEEKDPLEPKEEALELESLDDSDLIEYDMKVSTIAGDIIDPLDIEEEDHKRKRPSLHKKYKIQEVIHKNQILLVQVVKEERGQKGAALTTYLSLAGRYCVLMPNSPQAGGVSRKISDVNDRKRLRETLASLEIPEDMGLIIRTAGHGRTRLEIRRDTDYLKRLWNDIREQTLQSIAPTLIYQEDNIIKRAVRDQYTKDIEDVIVDGEEGYKSAKMFMKKLMPSHTKKVQQYKNPNVPLFIFYKIEEQIEKMHFSTVMLPSGGSIVLNSTEALVAIDINSGRATRERHIEETALHTNLEAAAEIARQVRLRDLAGLIVIDFIDMDDPRHAQQVERKVREAFRYDRARVQMGKISPFGLLELSRQRLRPSILEASSQPCPHCEATGFIRSTESMALQVLRALEEEGIARRSKKVKAVVLPKTAFYLLNEKRGHLINIEKRHQLSIIIEGDSSLSYSEFRLIQLDRAITSSSERPDDAPLPTSSSLQKKSDKVKEEATSLVEKNSDKNQKHKQNRRSQKRKRFQHKDNNSSSTSPLSQEPADVTTQDLKSEISKESTSSSDNSETPSSQNKGTQHNRRRHRNRHKRRHNRSESETYPQESPSSSVKPLSSMEVTASSGLTKKNKMVTKDPAETLGMSPNNNPEEGSQKTSPRRRRGWLKRLLE